MKADTRLSRRDALVAGATMAAGAAAAGGLAGEAQAQDVRRFATLPAVDHKHRILLRAAPSSAWMPRSAISPKAIC